MKFSLFFEMQISQPTLESERHLFRACVEQAELADRLGYHAVWAVEHHGLAEYSHCSAPEVFLSYVAGRTQRVRLGHGVTLTPSRYNHPIRIAERIATLDIVSDGRVEWGSGKSSSLVEQVAFETEIPKLHEQWLEAQKMIPLMWQTDVFEWHGAAYDIAPTRVIPKPVQRPHPPMHAACSKPDSTRLAAELGLGALNFGLGDDDYLTEKVQLYKRTVAASKPADYVRTDHYACTIPTLVLQDDRKACEYGFRGARFFAEAMSAYYLSGDRPTSELDVPRDFLTADDLAEASRFRNTPGSQLSCLVGSPDVARETVSRFARAGVDELILIMQMGTVPNELVNDSVRIFAEKVMPHFDNGQ
jgi:alkanesulfonate monooxygenase SsuD/methylene tetrahydromethanopterin reductase-like flavin-dependent oxidoreductase (luciferase family)